MKKVIKINGMSCGHCVKHVETALKEIAGVKAANVSLAEQSATVELTQAVDDAAIKAAIEDAGYEVVTINTL